jgi:hypothetical protein
MNKAIKIILYIILGLIFFSGIFSIYAGAIGIFIILPFPIIFLLFIALGIYSFKKPTLKPIYISFTIGIILGIIALFVIIKIFPPPQYDGGLWALGIVPLWLSISLGMMILSIIVGLTLSYIKTKNKAVLIIMILSIILFIIHFILFLGKSIKFLIQNT